jgi:AraC-like DNA-binding protein
LNNIIGSSVYAQFVSLFDELYMAYSIKNAGYRLKCQSRIMDIFHLLIRETDFAGKPFSPKIEKVLGFMAEHRNVSHSVEELSRIAGLSPSHFRSLFKQTTGLSVNDYQIRSRLDQAKELLIGSDCNVTEAALAAGFTDIYYFSRLSRKKRA